MKEVVTREPVLQVENLHLTYETRRGDVKAVQDVSFTIHEGEAFGLVGESGCGKSTVAVAVMGYRDANARIDSGQILFKGRNLLDMSEKELQVIRGREIAMIYQDPMVTLNPSIRVGGQLVEVLQEHKGLSKQDAYSHCVQTLNKVQMPDPEQVMTRYPHQLSGGQQQRVVIAMALLCDPALLVMDEPTTALDATIEATVLDLIAALRQDLDTAILYISHNLGVIARVCDRVGVMYASELMEKASVDEVFLRPFHPYTRGLMGCIPGVGASKRTSELHPIPGRVPPLVSLPEGCVFEPRCSYARDTCVHTHPSLMSIGGDRSVRCGSYERIAQLDAGESGGDSGWSTHYDSESKEKILTVSEAKTFYTNKVSWVGRLFGRKTRNVKAVDEVSLDVQPQTILGIVGESGCGKTTLAKTIAGLVPSTSGELEFLGVDISKVVEKRPKKILRELQMVFQNPDSTLNPTQTTRQILGRPLQVTRSVPRSELNDEIHRLLEAVNLDDSYLHRKPRQMSGGEKQRVAIARAFASKPELVVCDEPVSALDVSVQCAVLNTLLGIQEEFGTSLLFISHDLHMVRYLCDTLIVMYLGKMAEVGPTEALFEPPYHPYTEALLSAVPVPDPSVKQARIRLEGAVPSALNPPTGCRFHTRCPRNLGEICYTEDPPARTIGPGHSIFCHIPLKELTRIEAVI